MIWLSNLAALLQVHWHRSLEEVPDDTPTVYIAHEFLDALPVHQFQKTERGWCERLVDVASDDSPLHFRLVLAPRPTPASKLLVDRRLGALPFDQSTDLLLGRAANAQFMQTTLDCCCMLDTCWALLNFLLK